MNTQSDSEYVAVIVPALERWWREHGVWSRRVDILVHLGWDRDDVYQEVLVSAITKSRGKSRWDPSRASVDACAAVVGRSRLLHLLDRTRGERVAAYAPLSTDEDGLRDLIDDDLDIWHQSDRRRVEPERPRRRRSPKVRTPRSRPDVLRWLFADTEAGPRPRRASTEREHDKGDD